jgi:programmed cell death protein 5
MANGNYGPEGQGGYPAGAQGGGMSQEEMARLEQLKKVVLGRILTREAKERLNRLRLIKPDLAAQVELYLIQVYQAGKIKSLLTDDQLREILSMLGTGKRFQIRKESK